MPRAAAATPNLWTEALHERLRCAFVESRGDKRGAVDETRAFIRAGGDVNAPDKVCPMLSNVRVSVSPPRDACARLRRARRIL